MGTALVLIGICIVAAFAEKESGCYTIDQLVSLYQEPLFVMYSVLMGVSCIGLYLLAKKMEQLMRDHGTSSPKYKRFARVRSLTRLSRWTFSLFKLTPPATLALVGILAVWWYANAPVAASVVLPRTLGSLWRAIDSLCEVRRGVGENHGRRHQPVCEIRHLRDLVVHVFVHFPAGACLRDTLAPHTRSFF